MFENFPYTNYHNLNLDWIIEKVKEAYGPDNPPPTFVMSVNGQTGDVIVYPDAVVKLPTVQEATWNIFRFANGTERGVEFSPGEMKRIDGTGRYKIYDEQNPPPYPVVSVNGETGNVILYRSAYIALPTVQEATWTIYRISSGTTTGIQFTAEKAQRISGSDRYDIYDAQNPPPYPVASVNGKTGIVTTPFVNPSESILDLDSDSPGDTWGFARNTLGGKATLYLDTTGNDVKAYIQYVSDDETIYKEYPLLTDKDIPESAGVVSVNGEFGVVTVYGSGISRSSTNAQTIDAALTGLETDVTNITDGIAIVANGDTHPQIASGQFVYVRNHSTLPDGLYRATAAIQTNGPLSTSNLQADGAGGLNALQSHVDSLNSNSVALARHTRKTDFALADLQAAVAEQNLAKYGLKPGDQKTINGYTYVIAGLNEMKGTNSYTCTGNHVALIVIPHTTQAWNASGYTYEGADGRGAGYLNSDLHYYLTNTVLPHVQNDLGSGHLYAHRKLLTNAVNQTGYNRYGTNDGCSSGWTWTDPIYIAALSEVQVYGAAIWSSSGYDTGEACKQLAVFEEYKNTDIFDSEYLWLRDVVSASRAALSDANGNAGENGASNARCVAGLILYH